MMGIGLHQIKLSVNHSTGVGSGDGYFDDDIKETVELTGLVQNLSSAVEGTIGVAVSSQMKIKVHVSSPKERNVSVGDSLKWHGNLYVVTAVDDGIMEENVVMYSPYRWTFTAEVKNGSA